MARLSSLIILSILLIAAMLYFFFSQSERLSHSPHSTGVIQSATEPSDKKVKLTYTKVAMPPVKPTDRLGIGKPGDIAKVGAIE